MLWAFKPDAVNNIKTLVEDGFPEDLYNTMKHNPLTMNTATTQILGIQELPSNVAEICMRRFWVQPKEEQLQAARFIGCGKDVVLIAGCGWGKSLVYCLPLIFWDRGVIVIISPLRAIMTEQHQKLKGLEISSICLVGGDESIMDDTIAKLMKGDY